MGQTQQTVASVSTQTPTQAPPTTGRGLGKQDTLGNSGAKERLGLGDPEHADGIDPAELLGEDTWRGRGNLIGNPPVRDESPPNMGIVEDEGTYATRLSAAKRTKGEQNKRANGMLDADGKVKDNRYWFTRVYEYVTRGEIEEAEAGTYWYPSYVMQCVRYFDQIYADNVAAADAGGPIEEHWKKAFEVAADEHETTLVNGLAKVGEVGMVAGGALLGGIGGAAAGGLLASATEDLIEATESLVAHMQAHIRFDLPRAEAWVFNSYYKDMDGAKISNFKADFMSMTGVFDRAAADMNLEIAEKVGLPSDWMPRMLQDWAMTHMLDADMATERADTWQRTEELVNSGKAGADPYTDEGKTLGGDITKDTKANAAGVTSIPSTNLRPTMKSSAEVLDDDAVRADVAANGSKQKSTGDRIRMLRGLLRGATFDDDEATVLSILKESVGIGDLATLVDGASAWEIASALDGAEYKSVRAFLKANYYAATSRSMATTLIRRCMDGETAEWEEEMIADIIEVRPDRRSIVEDIGKAYPDGGSHFADGLDKLQWQLDGAEQDTIEKALGV